MLLDLDGVLYVEDEPVAGARDAVEALRAGGLTLRAAVRRANAVAALSVTRLGAQASFPSRAEVEQFLAGVPS